MISGAKAIEVTVLARRLTDVLLRALRNGKVRQEEYEKALKQLDEVVGPYRRRCHEYLNNKEDK